MAETTTTSSDSGDAIGASTTAATFEYFGWVYHVGINSIGHEYCHVRFIFIRSKHVEMYKRDPHLHPGIKPIRRGVVGPTLMVEEAGRRKVPHGEVHVLRFFNQLDESKKGEIACATAEEAQKWVEAFGQSKQQAEYELLKAGSSTRNKLSIETEINLDEHRPRVRRYASGLKKLIKIGQGPEVLLSPFSNRASSSADGLYERDSGDAVETYHWKCVRTINGVRIFEDVANSENGRGVIVKAVGVIQTSEDTAFEVLLNLDKHQRYEWDMLTGDLELLDSYDGHYDVVYGTFDPRWHSKRDFIFSRQWFRGQDGAYTILHFPAVHRKKPPRSGYLRIKLNPSTWEIRNLNSCMGSDTPRCLVTQMLEMNSAGWGRWKKSHSSKFERSVPYAMLCLVGGLKEYVGANPALKSESSGALVQTKLLPVSSADYYESNVKDEFYDAISTDSLSSDEEESDDDDDDDDALDKMETKVKLNKIPESDANKDLDSDVAPISIDLSQFPCSYHKRKDDADTNCWSTPSGKGFMIRGKNYLKDNSKVTGGEPLLNLIGTDWFKVDKPMDNVALHPRCLVQEHPCCICANRRCYQCR